ncbi:MAG: hypothetical protein ACLFPQ_04390 [Candidatus Woesearchaeota archaeon]
MAKKTRKGMRLFLKELKRKYLKLMFGKKYNSKKKKLTHFYRPAMIFLILAVIIGSAHGLYVSMLRENRHQEFYGNDMCNGIIFSGHIIAQQSDSSLSIFQRLIIRRGTATLRIYDPSGELLSEFNDWEHIQRNKIINIDKHGQGKYYFEMECDKADIDYIIRIDVI